MKTEMMSGELPFIETSTDSADGENGCSSLGSAHSHNHQRSPAERLLTANNEKERSSQQKADAKLHSKLLRSFGSEVSPLLTHTNFT